MRKLATAAAVSLALASGGAFGLGLGDIEMRSALNQPMDAEIRLSSVKPGELEGMIVQLASAEAFARAGIERTDALADLEFKVDESGSEPVIRIISNKPVVEPFLNFLLEVDWPQGRMVREYTVLLDPPVFMTPSATERNTAADQPALVQRGDDALVVPTPIERTVEDAEGVEVELLGLAEEMDSSTVVASPDDGEIVTLDSLGDLDTGSVSLTDLGAPNTSALASRQGFDMDSIQVELLGSTEEVNDNTVVDNQSGRTPGSNVAGSVDGSTIVSLEELDIGSTPESNIAVNRGDTLYEIAQTNLVSGVSVQQMMLAILAANESSFINNNINLVRAGATLNIPEAADAAQLPQAQALAAIGEQNQLWQEYRDQLRGRTATQIAQAPEAQSTASDAERAAAADVPATPNNAAEQPIETAGLSGVDAADELSAEARAILDRARSEILDRDELKIVADNAPSSTTASATADETDDNNETQRLGEINRKLKLAREELSSTRLQSGDLSDQANELQNTSENLDALVSLRQNEVAQLEAQLENARKASEGAARTEVADATENAMQAGADAVTDAAGNVADSVAGAGERTFDMASNALDTTKSAASDALTAGKDAAGNVITDASSIMSNGADKVGNAAGELVDSGADAAEDVVESGTNALTAAGENLAQVELLDENDDPGAISAGGTVAPVPLKQTSWVQNFLNDPKQMMIAGIGGVGLLGVLGTLLFRRRRDDDDSLLAYGDDVEFIDDDEAVDLQAELNGQLRDAKNPGAGIGTGLGAAAAGTAAAAGAAVTGVAAATRDGAEKVFGDDDHYHNDQYAAQAPQTPQMPEVPRTPQMPEVPLQQSFDDLDDASRVHDSREQVAAKPPTANSMEKDDTISEVDVYLAYGLHGQAEELLSKAIDRNPDNPEYAHKLLQTYHVQGNADGFRDLSANFHARFGGEANPAWSGIATMGAELRPEDPLFAAGHDAVAAIGTGHSDGAKFEAEDFLPASEEGTGSISRSFDLTEQEEKLKDIDESDFLDQSIDPAFAFDEGDLEATGDFSSITKELANEVDESVNFSGLNASVDDAKKAVESATDSVRLSDADLLDDALTLEELDDVAGTADDLTLDLDQLSDDLELDTAELLNSDLSDLEIPDLTANNELLDDDSANDNIDEMDTMLDLAKAYIDMGDKDSASSALGEIVKSGSPEQVTEAETLLRKIS